MCIAINFEISAIYNGGFISSLANVNNPAFPIGPLCSFSTHAQARASLLF